MSAPSPRRRRWWNRPRFDALELLLIGLLMSVGAMGFLVQYTQDPELRDLRRRYGPSRFSEGPEEWAIRDFFGDRRDGFFVDVGANHYKDYSKTYFLESQLGWRGLAIEPQERFAADYAAHRPRTKFLPFFVSDVSNAEAKMYVLWWNSTVASGDKAFAERHGPNPTEVTATTITLNDLFEAEGVERIDFLSMDIELWEPKALAGFAINRYQPELVCIEALPSVRQFILDYFARHGYVVVSKYLRADEQNLYFSRLVEAR